MRLAMICPALLIAAIPIALPARAAAPAPIASQSRIAVSGAGQASGSYDLTKVYGDWFVTASDGHATLRFDTGMGPRRVILEIEWDGKGLTQTFNAANNSLRGPRNHPSFYLTLDGSGAGQQLGEPQKSDSIVLTITHMDGSSIEAAFHGSTTVNSIMREGNPQWRISGVISVHRAAQAAAPPASGSFGNCDAQIHDKLTGAEWRSPSECEVKFDQHVRQVLDRAFAPVAGGFRKDGWNETKKPNLGPISSIARHSESSPYQISINDAGPYAMTLNLGADAPGAKSKADAQQAILNRMAELMKDMAKNAQALEELGHQAAAISQTANLQIRVTINESSNGVVNFQAAHTVTPLAGGGTVLFVPAAQAPTGGGPDAAQPETTVLLGAWGTPAAKPLGKGEESISTAGALNKAKPLLSVQNIHVRIYGGKDAAQQVIQRIDWAPLRALLAGN